MENAETQDLVECPYDKHHMILRKRIQVHLIRCRRNYTGGKKVTCPFNVTHVLNEPELDFHVKECPERKILEHYMNGSTAPRVPTPPMPEYKAEENWDDEPPAASYKPKTIAVKANVLRHLNGATPSERKEFRKQERLRLLEINNSKS